MHFADKYIEKHDLPKHTQIESMAQFGESAMFKQYFSDWRDIDSTEGLGETHTIGSVAKVEHELGITLLSRFLFCSVRTSNTEISK